MGWSLLIFLPIRQMVNGLWFWIWLGTSTLESVKRRRLSAIKVHWNWNLYWSCLSSLVIMNLSEKFITFDYYIESFLFFSKLKLTDSLQDVFFLKDNKIFKSKIYKSYWHFWRSWCKIILKCLWYSAGQLVSVGNTKVKLKPAQR